MTCSGGVVTFSYTDWVAAFPELAYITQPQAQGYFNRACMMCNNTPLSIIPTTDAGGAPYRENLLNLLTAHIGVLNAPSPVNGQSPSPNVVGRLSDASEGSVSASFAYSTEVPGSMAWYIQTRYGAEYWNATAPFRTAKPIPKVTPQGSFLYGGGPFRRPF